MLGYYWYQWIGFIAFPTQQNSFGLSILRVPNIKDRQRTSAGIISFKIYLDKRKWNFWKFEFSMLIENAIKKELSSIIGVLFALYGKFSFHIPKKMGLKTALCRNKNVNKVYAFYNIFAAFSQFGKIQVFPKP